MISRELAVTMGEISEEMAIWGSIIRWWKLKETPVVDAIDAIETSLCSLCAWVSEKELECGQCALGRIEICCSEDSLYQRVKKAANREHGADWKRLSNEMFNTLVSLLPGADSLKDDVKGEPKVEEPTYSIGDVFELDGNKYTLIQTSPSVINFVGESDKTVWTWQDARVYKVHHITQGELNKLCGSFKFTRISKNDKS